YGGYNAAGRSSFDQSYRRMIFESLDADTKAKTVEGLAALMGLSNDGNREQAVVDGTLIRAIDPALFDPAAAPCNAKLDVSYSAGAEVRFQVRKRQLPEQIPAHWQVNDMGDG